MRRSLFVAALLLLACDPAPVASTVDAATIPDDAATPVDTTPELPIFTPCPAGWSERAHDGGTTCEPASAPTCTGATFLLPGSSACEPIDAGCGTDPFPTIPSGRTAVFVAAGSTGGDGTREHPFGTIGEALADDALVAIGAGTYEESLELPDGVELLGVCAEQVIVRGTTTSAVTLPPARTAALTSITLTGDAGGLYTAGAITLRGVAVISARESGLAVIGSGSSLDGERVLVRDTGTNAMGRLGRGLEMAHGVVSLRSAVIDGSHDGGIATTSGTLTLADVAVRHTHPNDAGRFGTGIAAFEGTEATLDRVIVESAAETGILLDDGVTATLRDVLVSDVLSETIMENGNGIVVGASVLTLERAWIRRASHAGIGLYRGSELHASDVWIQETQASGVYAIGVGVVSSSATFTRLAIRDTQYTGVLAVGTADAPASASLTDVSIERVTELGEIGDAALVGHNASMTIERFAMRDLRVIGVHAFGEGSHLTLRAGSIAHVLEGTIYGYGRGIEVDDIATGEVTNVTVEDVRETGVVTFGIDASLTIDGLVVRSIHERSCVTSTCAGEGGGSGVVAGFAGRITARALEVDGAPLCGVQVVESATFDLTSGEIRGSAIGACVQVPGYDVTRVVDGVSYRDNDTNVDSAGTFIPPAGPRHVDF